MLGNVCFVVMVVIIVGIGVYSLVLKLWMLGFVLLFLALMAGIWFLFMLSDHHSKHKDKPSLSEVPEVEVRFRYEVHYRKEKRR